MVPYQLSKGHIRFTEYRVDSTFSLNFNCGLTFSSARDSCVTVYIVTVRTSAEFSRIPTLLSNNRSFEVSPCAGAKLLSFKKGVKKYGCLAFIGYNPPSLE